MFLSQTLFLCGFSFFRLAFAEKSGRHVTANKLKVVSALTGCVTLGAIDQAVLRVDVFIF
jgi:hypothetical protein